MHSLYKQQLNLIANFNQKSSVLDRLVSTSSQSREFATASSVPITAAITSNGREAKRLNLIKQTEVTFSVSPGISIESQEPLPSSNGFERDVVLMDEAKPPINTAQEYDSSQFKLEKKIPKTNGLNGHKVGELVETEVDQMIAE
jgi:hypothetical protein